LHPVVAEFQDLINTDPIVRMYLNQMISQVPDNRQYSKRHLQSVPQLLRLINAVLTMAPEFGDSMVMTPLGAILDWTMGTPAGFAAYRDRRINASLRRSSTHGVSFWTAPSRCTCSTTRRLAGCPRRPVR
jgi:phosphatidylserine decarboxylase